MQYSFRSFLLFFSLTFSTIFIVNSFQYPDFKSWDLACSILPQYRVAGSTYNFKAAQLDWKEMETALKEFANIMRLQLATNLNEWVDDTPPYDFFLLHLNSFWPYAQKLVVPIGSTLAFHGDIHGDIHSLLLYLKDLQRQGYLDAADAFKIKDPKFYLIFLGDYTDRGNYGAEVIYTLLRLKIQNPDRVFLVRGNHEDQAINAVYGFEAEMKEKFGHRAHLKTLYNFYHLLPVVLYVGSGATGQMNYLQCCHGGMEIGYLPKNLLAHPGSIAYEHIQMLQQVSNLKMIAPDIAESNQVFNLYPIKDFKPNNPQQIGFLWNDFYIPERKEFEKTEPWVAGMFIFDPTRGWSYGRDITQRLLNYSGIASNKIVGVIRAHQHDRNMQGMMGRILDANYPDSLGVAKLWREQNNTGKDSLWPGIVCTFNLSPDTPQGAAKDAGFDFDTYGLIKTGKNYPYDWSLDVHRIYQQFTGAAVNVGATNSVKAQPTS